MKYFQWAFVLCSLLSYVFADVEILKPGPEQSFDASSGSVTINIEWDDDTPNYGFSALENALSFDIVLMTGTNDRIGAVKQVGSNLKNTVRSFAATISNNVGPNGNYFFQIYTAFPYQGYTIHYSNRFRLTGMKGSAASYTFGGALFSETGAQPIPQWNAGGTALKINTNMFTVPYNQQKGWVKYAPTQTNPTAAVTATTWSRRHPESEYTVFASPGSFPNVWTTVTPSGTYVIKTKENSVPPVDGPTYYYPASSRVLSATLSGIHKKRWL